MEERALRWPPQRQSMTPTGWARGRPSHRDRQSGVYRRLQGGPGPGISRPAVVLAAAELLLNRLPLNLGGSLCLSCSISRLSLACLLGGSHQRPSWPCGRCPQRASQWDARRGRGCWSRDQMTEGMRGLSATEKPSQLSSETLRGRDARLTRGGQGDRDTTDPGHTPRRQPSRSGTGSLPSPGCP